MEIAARYASCLSGEFVRPACIGGATLMVRAMFLVVSEVLHRNIYAVFEARDALGTEALAGGLEAATRRRHAAADHAPVESLSGRERRILERFADGSNPATTARTLCISAQTLRNRLHNVNRKRRTHNRLEAVTHALRRGLPG